ncbi:MAG TPA: PepSY domain-containing protein [Thiobacillaceae bacterium]|nr:PepSY domain-containing protein [Thiobacillaceae bacterium]
MPSVTDGRYAVHLKKEIGTSAPKRVALAIATILLPASVFASTECTKMPAEKWLPQSEMKTHVEKAGFTVQRIKQDNSCYEVKGQSNDGKSVELYRQFG